MPAADVALIAIAMACMAAAGFIAGWLFATRYDDDPWANH